MLKLNLPEWQSHYPESSDARPHIRLNPQWRIIADRDGQQRILQFRNSAATASADWRGCSYCSTRDALLRCCDHHCGPIDPVARASLEALPERIEESVSGCVVFKSGPNIIPEFLSRPETVFPKTGLKSPNEINGPKSLVGRGRSSLPLNLVGGGSCQFPRARTAERKHRVAAAIDAELGTGNLVMSRDGVPAYLIPSRRARR